MSLFPFAKCDNGLCAMDLIKKNAFKWHPT